MSFSRDAAVQHDHREALGDWGRADSRLQFRLRERSQHTTLPAANDSLARKRMAAHDSFDRNIPGYSSAITSSPNGDWAGQSVSRCGSSPHPQAAGRGCDCANAAILSPAKVGRPISVIVELEVESERPEELEQVKRSLSEAPEIQQCYYVTGDVDFILIASVTDMSEYEQLTKRLFFSNPNIKKFRTYVAMDRVKATFEMPIA